VGLFSAFLEVENGMFWTCHWDFHDKTKVNWVVNPSA
jgi:hypothetical protein